MAGSSAETIWLEINVMPAISDLNFAKLKAEPQAYIIWKNVLERCLLFQLFLPILTMSSIVRLKYLIKLNIG